MQYAVLLYYARVESKLVYFAYFTCRRVLSNLVHHLPSCLPCKTHHPTTLRTYVRKDYGPVSYVEVLPLLLLLIKEKNEIRDIVPVHVALGIINSPIHDRTCGELPVRTRVSRSLPPSFRHPIINTHR